jgi:diguanylate cyclase (GGDEF)-like protein
VRDVTEKKQREAELRAQAERLRSLSLRDELSGLYNRRGFLELGQQQLRNIARSQRAGCLFYADLNGMKAINDELGHEMGDRALAATATLLTSVFRDSDVVARLGGDEFAALASDCDTEGQISLKRRLESAIDGFNAQGLERFRLSISVGSALYDPRAPLKLEALMEQADAKMYEEKKARACARLEQSALGCARSVASS